MNSSVNHDRIVEQAAEWVTALKDLDARRQAELTAWLMESPRHLEQFFLMAELETQVGEIGRDLKVPDIGPGENVVALRSNQPSPAIAASPARARRRWLAAAAACGGLLIAGTVAVNTYPSWYGYSTGIGEIRSVALPDGSTLVLNTLSRVKVDMDSRERRLEMVAGEALFKVSKDPARPFRVAAEGTMIQALGTEFNVNRRAGITRVSVLEGAVGISREGKAASAPPDQVELGAGAETNILPGGAITPITALNRAKVLAWQQRRLVFKEDSLAHIAAEFNRYNRTPRIRLVDSSIDGIRLSGVFDADAPEALLLFLEKVNALSVERTRDEVIIRAASKAASESAPQR